MRNYKRKTQKGQTAPDVLLRAVREVKLNKRSIRSIAKEFKLSHRTLARYCLKFTEEQLTTDTTIAFKLGYNKRQVFSDQQEEELVALLIQASSIFHGLLSKDVRRLAYEFGSLRNITYPDSWKYCLGAGPDWYSAFMKRHSTLKNIFDADSQNKVQSSAYFSKLKEVIMQYKLKPKRIWNMDETGIPTDQIYEQTIDKQIGRLNSHEYGRLITMTLAVSALGTFTPPYFLAPDESIKDVFIKHSPKESKVDVNVFGWMEADHFYDFLKHLAEHTESSPENKILLMIENCTNYLSIKTLEFIQNNGIILLTFPTNDHNLQPLDRIVFGPFRKKFNEIYYDVANSNGDITESDIPIIVKKALNLALIPTNIISGFQNCGIYPIESSSD